MKHEHVYALDDLRDGDLPCLHCGEPLVATTPELREWLNETAEVLAGLPD